LGAILGKGPKISGVKIGGIFQNFGEFKLSLLFFLGSPFPYYLKVPGFWEKGLKGIF